MKRLVWQFGLALTMFFLALWVYLKVVPQVSTTVKLLPASEILTLEKFGQVKVYTALNDIRGVALYLASEEGWTERSEQMVLGLQELGITVFYLNTVDYLQALQRENRDCLYFAGEIERFSQVVEKKTGSSVYHKPLLIGEGLGAELSYIALAESPNTFSGAIAINLEQRLKLPAPLCEDRIVEAQGKDEALFNTSEKSRNAGDITATKSTQEVLVGRGSIERSFPIYLNLSSQPMLDKRLVLVKSQGPVTRSLGQSTSAVEELKDDLKSQVLSSNLPELLHSKQVISVEESAGKEGWYRLANQAIKIMEKSDAQLSKLTSTSADTVAELPVEELPPGSEAGCRGLVVLISGDGGWASIDKAIGNSLKENNFAVIGLNSLQYFWRKRTQEEATFALDAIIKHYSASWRCRSVAVVGYSFGADVAPFMVASLPQNTQEKISSIVLINPSDVTDFEVELTDWLGLESADHGFAVLPEINKLKAYHIRCIYAAQEEDTACRDLNPLEVQVSELPGDHHFDGNYEALNRLILDSLT